ncbi:OmpA family protein, partial [Corallococcus sp. CA047B]
MVAEHVDPPIARRGHLTDDAAMGRASHRYGRAALGLLLLAAPGRAQEAAPLTSFSLERLEVNPGLGALTLGNGELLAPGSLRVSLLGHYQRAPRVVHVDGQDASLLRYRTTGLLALAVGVLPWLELQGQLPVVVRQRGDDLTTSQAIASPSRSGLGAPRFDVRLGLLGRLSPEALHLALDLGVQLPVGASGALVRDSGFSGWGRLLLGKQLGPVSPALEAGVLLRPSVSPASSADARDSVGSELQVGAGLTVGRALRGEVSARGAYAWEQQRTRGEVQGGLRYAFARWLEGFALGGVGLGDAPGTPTFRVLAGLAFFNGPAPRPPPENIVYELVTALPRAPEEAPIEAPL